MTQNWEKEWSKIIHEDGLDYEKMSDFIRLEVQKSRQEERDLIVKELEGLKKHPDCGQNPDYPSDQCTPICGHNQALNEAIEIIKNEK